MIGLSPFLIFIIVAVTAAQIAGNGKRKNKQDKNKNPRETSTLIKKITNKEFSEGEKIQAEPEAPSFEVDGKNSSNVDGFDVK